MEQQYILNAIDAALQAGEKILSIYDNPASDFQVEKKADNSPLTIADRKAHETICRFLADTPFPLLSEEGKHLPFSERRSWETLWIVDPLDGTKEFIKRNGEFTVNIALVHHSVPVMGVIYVPVKRSSILECMIRVLISYPVLLHVMECRGMNCLRKLSGCRKQACTNGL